MSRRMLHEAWKDVLDVMKERTRAGRPLGSLSLSGYQNFNGIDDFDRESRMRLMDEAYRAQAHYLLDPERLPTGSYQLDLVDGREDYSSESPIASLRISDVEMAW